jgi:hypothetical protein
MQRSDQENDIEISSSSAIFGALGLWACRRPLSVTTASRNQLKPRLKRAFGRGRPASWIDHRNMLISNRPEAHR